MSNKRNRQRNRGRNPKTQAEGGGFYSDTWWQSKSMNTRYYQMIRDYILKLAINRFKWHGLPETVNIRYLEQTLLLQGWASLATPPHMPDVMMGLKAVWTSSYLNAYGEPSAWTAIGQDGRTNYRTGWGHGALVYDNKSCTSIWNSMDILARKAASILRTADVNRGQQMTPFLLTAPRGKEMELTNLYKQIDGGEPAVLADDNFSQNFKIESIKTDVPYMPDQFNADLNNTLNQIYLQLGIDHLAYQKGERMIEDEAKGNSKPTTLIALDGLDMRRIAAEHINSLDLGYNVTVTFNEDVETYNFDFLNTIREQMEVGE